MCGCPLRSITACALAAGELIQVCVFGRCKCKVDGITPAGIDIGDSLVTHNAAGIAQLAALACGGDTAADVDAVLQKLMAIFARALRASAADLDIIPVFVQPALGVMI